MAKRPALTNRSFLAAVFSPKKNPVPTGLRKKKLAGVKGRSAARLRSYNGMTALNQQILERAGQREAYLRGDATIADAKRVLRNAAVDLGIAKPLKPKIAPIQSSHSIGDRTRVLDHLWTTLTGTTTRRPVKLGAVRQGALLMTRDQAMRALRMTATEIKEAGVRGSPEEMELNGKVYNPFWYH